MSLDPKHVLVGPPAALGDSAAGVDVEVGSGVVSGVALVSRVAVGWGVALADGATDADTDVEAIGGLSWMLDPQAATSVAAATPSAIKRLASLTRARFAARVEPGISVRRMGTIRHRARVTG